MTIDLDPVRSQMDLQGDDEVSRMRTLSFFRLRGLTSVTMQSDKHTGKMTATDSDML